MDQLRQGIHLRGYAQKNPKQEYKRESFELFASMLDRFKHVVITVLSRVQVRSEAEIEALEAQRRQLESDMQFQHANASAMQGEASQEDHGTPYVRDGRKVGRNEPCPCGSGKKYKHCHGRIS
jgi:preprotein translocase subunit SecA